MIVIVSKLEFFEHQNIFYSYVCTLCIPQKLKEVGNFSYLLITLCVSQNIIEITFCWKIYAASSKKGRGICSFYPIVQRRTYQYLWTNAKFGLNKKRKCKNAHHLFYSYVGWKLLKCMICREMIWTTPSLLPSPPHPCMSSWTLLCY